MNFQSVLFTEPLRMKLSGSIGCGLVLLLLSATVAYSEIEDVDDLDASESTVLFDEDDLAGQAEGVPAEVPVFLEKVLSIHIVIRVRSLPETGNRSEISKNKFAKNSEFEI